MLLLGAVLSCGSSLHASFGISFKRKVTQASGYLSVNPDQVFTDNNNWRLNPGIFFFYTDGRAATMQQSKVYTYTQTYTQTPILNFRS